MFALGDLISHHVSTFPVLELSGGHGLGCIGLPAATVVLMGARAPAWSPTDDPNPSQSRPKVFFFEKI